MRIGYLLSSFDLLNVGDLGVTDAASASCDELVVGVLTDDDVEFTLGRRPVVPHHERLELVSHVRGIARAVTHLPGLEQSADLVLVHADHRRMNDRLDASVEVLTPIVQTSSPVLRHSLRPARFAVDEEVA